MVVSETKSNLIKNIRNSTNPYLLEEMARLMDMEQENLDVYVMSKEQTIAISEAKDQYKKGKTLTSDQADEEIDKWLEK